MKTSLKNKDSFTRSLDVTVPWASLKDDFVKEFNNQKKKFKIPGFRAGKVPANIVKKEIGPHAKPDKIVFTPTLPKTRSGKIMRRILRKIAEGDLGNMGDTSTLADPSVVESLITSVS